MKNISKIVSAVVVLGGVGGLTAWMSLTANQLPANTIPPVAEVPQINENVTQLNIGTTICDPSWSALSYVVPVDYTTFIKNQQMATGSYDGLDPADYDEMYIIPPFLGGSPKSTGNMWPEPITNDVQGQNLGVSEKAKTDQWLHDQVCSNAMTLSDAQIQEVTNWTDAYQKAIK